MELKFIGAAHEVTGSCHYVHVGDKNLLVDCGMEQGTDIYENQEIPVEAKDIDYVFVTHAHIDHSGLLPLLYANGFRGKIYATDQTTDLCNIMLKDSAHIQESEAEWKNRKGKRSGDSLVVPLYTVENACDVMRHFVRCMYDETVQVSDEVTVKFREAGHLLGSAFIEMWLKEGDTERKLVFSGDLGSGGKPLLRNPDFAKDADYVLIESTYGDREHDKPEDFAKCLADVIERTLSRGGNVVIPAFSVGRTQEILYFIRRIKSEHMVSNVSFPVVMDSPMAVEATEIYKDNVADVCNDEARELLRNKINPIKFPGLKVVVSSEESKEINDDPTPKVIISASGMCEAGRIRHHLKHNLWRKECTIVFVGYQCPGTLGNKLLDGTDEVRLFGEPVAVCAEITKLPGISGHADSKGLLAWLGRFENKPKKVFVVHGENEVTDNFALKIREKLGFDAIAPYSGDAYDLISGLMTEAGPKVMVKKKPSAIANSVFEKLLAAGERLIAVIKECRGMTNKDLTKFTEQITNLCDKWMRKNE